MDGSAARATRLTRAGRLKVQNRRLRAALHTRPAIEQAKGVIIARTGCTPDEAFSMLVAQSQHENRKLRAIAAELVTRNAGRNRRPG